MSPLIALYFSLVSFFFLQMLMSLDPSCPVDKPALRTEAQTQTSVGLSVFNVHRLKKLREDMRVSANCLRAGCVLSEGWSVATVGMKLECGGGS